MINQKYHVDIAWINRLSYSLTRFKKVKTDVYNCRCPICGDSKKNKRIGRFYFYKKKQKMNVMCHNCGYSKSLFNFIKDQFPFDFEEYKKETIFDSFKPRELTKIGQNRPTVTPVDDNTLEELSETHSVENVLGDCINMSDLPDTHFAKSYLLGRSFSEKELERLYFSDNFKSVAAKLNAESADKLPEKESRIIIPFVNEYGQVEMLQGRSLDPTARIKYVSIKVNDEVEKVYGLYEANRDKTTYCVEGPFDSLFVDNCLASCDANLTRVDADVFIWDNQPRNKDVLKYMEAAIEAKKKVVIWPFVPKEKMDINDLIKKGVTREQLMKTIKKSTYSGLTARMKFMEWKKL